MDVVVSVCIVRRGALGARVWEVCDCFVMQMVYVRVLYASCGSPQCCVLHDLKFDNTGSRCIMRPYGRGILQSRFHNCFVAIHACLILSTPPCVAMSDFICEFWV